MTLERSSLAGQGDVTKSLRLQQLVEHGQHVGLVLAPAEGEHLGQGVHLRNGELGQQAETVNVK